MGEPVLLPSPRGGADIRFSTTLAHPHAMTAMKRFCGEASGKETTLRRLHDRGGRRRRNPRRGGVKIGPGVLAGTISVLLGRSRCGPADDGLRSIICAIRRSAFITCDEQPWPDQHQMIHS
jgi:hypothetical protein